MVFALNQLKELIFRASCVNLSSFRLSSSSTTFYLWHSCLGHIYASRLNFLASTGVLGSLDNHNTSDCSGCKLTFFLLYHLIKVFLLLLLLLILCILTCGDLFLYPPKEVLDIMSLLLMILFVSLGSILWNIDLIISRFYHFTCL